jgi:hypothetical protein
MKGYEGVGVHIHTLLTSALAEGEWSASCPCHFTPGEGAPRYPLDKRLGGPQIRSARRGEEKIRDPTTTRTPNPWYPARSQSLYRLRYPG